MVVFSVNDGARVKGRRRFNGEHAWDGSFLPVGLPIVARDPKGVWHWGIIIVREGHGGISWSVVGGGAKICAGLISEYLENPSLTLTVPRVEDSFIKSDLPIVDAPASFVRYPPADPRDAEREAAAPERGE